MKKEPNCLETVLHVMPQTCSQHQRVGTFPCPKSHATAAIHIPSNFLCPSSLEDIRTLPSCKETDARVQCACTQTSIKRGGEGRGCLGPKILCIKNGPTRLFQW